jgi:hypothetical protein
LDALRNLAFAVSNGDMMNLRALQSALEDYRRAVKEHYDAASRILTSVSVGQGVSDVVDRLMSMRLNQRQERAIETMTKDFPIPKTSDCEWRLTKWIGPIDDKLDPKNLGVSMAAYLKLRQGMSYFEVQNYIGSVGTPQSEAGNLRTVAWTDGTKTIVATFRANVLIAKAQSGL